MSCNLRAGAGDRGGIPEIVSQVSGDKINNCNWLGWGGARL